MACIVNAPVSGSATSGDGSLSAGAASVGQVTADALDLSPYRLDVDERFDAPQLDRARWFPHFLPHWSTLERSTARAETGRGLRLVIDADAPLWAPHLGDGSRVAHLQTGHFSGPLGSGVGQHRFRADLAVATEAPELALWHLGHGVVEVRARAIRHPDAMVAFWPMGAERDPRDSGELCVFEIFGHEIDDTGGLVGVGVKAHHDDRLVTDFEKVRVVGDLTEFHDYAMEWLPDRIRFFIDGRLVKTSVQAIDYPMQLMLDVFESEPASGTRDMDALPHVFEVAHVRSWVRN